VWTNYSSKAHFLAQTSLFPSLFLLFVLFLQVFWSFEALCVSANLISAIQCILLLTPSTCCNSLWACFVSESCRRHKITAQRVVKCCMVLRARYIESRFCPLIMAVFEPTIDLSFLVLSCLVLSCLCLVWSCLVLSSLVLSRLDVPCLVLSCLVLYYVFVMLRCVVFVVRPFAEKSPACTWNIAMFTLVASPQNGGRQIQYIINTSTNFCRA
jgi:hypothetical protein